MEALGSLKDPSASNALTRALSDSNPEVRRAAIDALDYIDPPPIDLLLGMLKSPSGVVRKGAAEVLDATGDARGKRRFQAALANNELAIVVGAIQYFIRMADPTSVAVLIRALNKYGDKRMATILLNCGHEGLEEAARSWAGRRGYVVLRSVGASGLRWDSGLPPAEGE
ncbi:MAG: HEAT repeat domain-containing protein [Desulfobacterales bacterium]|nr:HEAT repeat domain-containing protein [Desulfobacterales bacterium]